MLCLIAARANRLLVTLCLAGAWFCVGVVALGQEAAPAQSSETVETTPSSENEQPLSARQEALVMRYRRFENSLLQLAEYLRRTDPARADLLVRAIGKSKENRIPEQMQQLVQLLERGQLGDAMERQEDVVARMISLLDLLQSEDRQDQLAKEQERILGLIQDVDKLIGQQKNARATTERGGSLSDAERQQDQVKQRADGLLEKIDDQDAAKQQERGDAPSSPAENAENGENSPSESSDEKTPSDQKDSSDNKNAGDKPSGEKPSSKSPDNESPEKEPMKEDPPSPAPGEEPSEPKPGEENSPSDSSSPNKSSPSSKPPQKGPSSPSQNGKPSDEESPSSDDSSESSQEQSSQNESQPSDQTPGREELQKAKKQMDRAIQELKAKQRDKASAEQDEALAELLKAKEKLEEILRQLREEERELMLAALEARFREMLARHLNVYNTTVSLGQIPADKREERHRARAIEISREESEIAIMAEKALALLQEEGSSIAFPEAVEQLRDDLYTVTRRLERAEVGELTQTLEKDILEGLEEMITALQKEMEKQKDQQQQQQQQQQQPGENALVDQLSELKMLRSLQYRINRRTKQMGRMIEGEQAQDPDLRAQLNELAGRQAKLQQATFDLSREKNQ